MTDKLKGWELEQAKNPGTNWRMRTYKGATAFNAENEGIFDELVVDHWLHIEQMDERVWVVRVGDRGMRVEVKADASVEITDSV